jgi:uncharacterized protein
MELARELVLTGAAFIGHLAIAVWLFNRLHAVAWPRRLIKTLEKALILTAAAVMVLFVVGWTIGGYGMIDPRLWLAYAIVCWLAAAAAIPLWLVPKLREQTPAELVCNDTTLIDVTQRLGYRPVHGSEARLFAALPGNELLTLAVQSKTLRMVSLPRSLDGLTIAHLSDLHMTGKIGREFYDCLVDETNALSADLVVITGDILEKEICLSWIGPTLGRLQARDGKYFILGNHERRLRNVAVLRQELVEAGLTNLGGRWVQRELRGAEVMLAGNELPWFGTAPAVPSAGPGSRAQDAKTFRILLSHSPDQLSWARAHGFDLMLAGHNHGGQIRLPYFGALIAPSWYGCRYAGGLYFEPPTLLHVSRGVCGIHPIRFNCPPELALLKLTCG